MPDDTKHATPKKKAKLRDKGGGMSQVQYKARLRAMELIKKIQGSNAPAVAAGKQVRRGGFVLNICGSGGTKYDAWNFLSERVAEAIASRLDGILSDVSGELHVETAEYEAGLCTIELKDIQPPEARSSFRRGEIISHNGVRFRVV